MQEGGSGKRGVGLVVDGDRERRGLDRRRAGHCLDARLGPAVAQAEREVAEGRVSFERDPDLLEESIEGGVAGGGIVSVRPWAPVGEGPSRVEARVLA
jgi:hypothetical protein